jgi:hypothetical protein
MIRLLLYSVKYSVQMPSLTKNIGNGGNGKVSQKLVKKLASLTDFNRHVQNTL